MLKPLLTRLLDHLVNQNQWARNTLLPFAGKTVRFNLATTGACLTILEDGGLAMAGDTAQGDASISLTPSLALRLLAGDTSAQSQVKVEGDTELATTLAKVLRGMKWDYEEDLSQILGDIPATKISEFGKHAAHTAKQQSINLAEMLTEYWQEELPLIAKKRHIEKFVQEVDQLRDDTARLEKRLTKLASTK
jgi:ubiquinone biosynthesis protein UbiJ